MAHAVAVRGSARDRDRALGRDRVWVRPVSARGRASVRDLAAWAAVLVGLVVPAWGAEAAVVRA